ncbi:unnamed protein product [Calypogeia fissa]
MGTDQWEAIGREADQDGASSGAVEVKGEEQQPLVKNGTANNDSVISVAPSDFGYNYGNRPYRDIAFSIAFAIFVTASLGVGIFAAFNRNSDYQLLGSASYSRDEGCTLPQGFHDGASSGSLRFRHLLSLDSLPNSMVVLLFVFLATLVVMAPVGFGFLYVLRKYAKEVVYVTIPFFVIIPAATAITLFVSCSMSAACQSAYDPTYRYFGLGLVLVLNVFYVWVLCRNWDRVELTIRIIRTASEALHQNLALLLVLPALNVSYLLYVIPAAFCLYFAYTNGKIVTNPEVVQDPDLVCGDRYGGRPCCVWETDSWVPAYFVLTVFSMLWGSVIMAEIRVFTISGTISQWYFSTAEASTVGNMKRSLANSFGPSFGTVCLSGLVVAFIQLIRSAIESSRSGRGEVGFAALIVRACLMCLLSVVEFLTKFTTNFAAITGESFCGSAHMTYDLLRRNLLSTVVVESVTARLLGQAVVVIAAVYGLLVWGGVTLFVQDGSRLWGGLWGFGVFACTILMIFLVYCMQVLLSVVDTVYICFAMDKDHNEVSKPEVHDVYVLLPAADDGTASLAVSRPSTRS